MKCIRSALGADVHHTTGCASILRIEVVGDNAKFLHRVLRDLECDGRIEQVGVLHAIEQDFGTRRALSVDVESNAAVGAVLAATSDLRIPGLRASVAAAYIA